MEACHLIFVGVGMAFLAMLLQIVGVTTPHWVSASGLASFELWRYCQTIPGEGSVCLNFPGDVADWLKAVRAFGIVALGLMGGGGACGVLFVFKADSIVVGRLTSALCAPAATCALVSIAVFAAKFDDLTGSSSMYKFDYSFGLCIAAAILSILATAVFRIARRANVQVA